MTLELQNAQGQPLTDFISAEVNVALESLANDFTFTASSVSGFPSIKQGDLISILVDGVKVLTGHIDEVRGSEAEGSHEIVYTGRDRTADLIDSDLNLIDDIKPSDSLTLKRLIELVVAHIQTDVLVIDQFDPPPFNLAEDIIAPQVGQNAFKFIAAYARKRQALLTSDGDGNIVITQSDPVSSNAVVQRLEGRDDNNIVSQTWSVDASRRFREYVYRGQVDPRALNFGGGSLTSVSDQSGSTTDGTVRAGRQKVEVETTSYSSEQLRDRSKWASQLARASSLSFRCVVKGHTSSADQIYRQNTLVQVNSDVADITRQMLLSGISFNQSEGTPTTSRLSFVEKDVFTINDRILSQKPVGSQNDVFKTLG